MDHDQFNFIDLAAFVLLIIGGINWGLVGLFDFNLVSAIFQIVPLIKVIYTLVGISALYSIYTIYKLKKKFTMSRI